MHVTLLKFVDVQEYCTDLDVVIEIINGVFPSMEQ